MVLWAETASASDASGRQRSRHRRLIALRYELCARICVLDSLMLIWKIDNQPASKPLHASSEAFIPTYVCVFARFEATTIPLTTSQLSFFSKTSYTAANNDFGIQNNSSALKRTNDTRLEAHQLPT